MKTLKWCPEFAIKHCKGFFTDPHDHVVIRSFGAELTHVPQCDGEVLFLDFNDVIRYNDAEGHRTEMPTDGPFNHGHASLIKRFVNRSKKELIVVNCEAGVTRSPSVVLAYRNVLGGDREEIFRKASPDYHLVEIMESVLRE